MTSKQWAHDLYLGSLDSYHFSTPRRCSFRNIIKVNPNLLAVRVAIDPTADGPRFGILRALDELILQPALAGYTVAPVNQFPCFVHITTPVHESDRVENYIRIGGVPVISLAKGELYQTFEDAQANKF